MTKRFAIASDSEGACRYYTGGTSIGIGVLDGHFKITSTDDRTKAATVTDHAVADTLAEYLTDLSHMPPADDRRTWFVIELSEPRR